MSSAPELLNRQNVTAANLTRPADADTRTLGATGWDRTLWLQPMRFLASLRRQRTRRLLRRADRARDRGDHAAAAALYTRALARDTERVDIRVQLAHMLKELARFGEAEAAYRQALSQRPHNGDIQLHLGHLLKLLGRTGEAIAAYSAAGRLSNGDNAAAFELRALGVIPLGDGDAIAAEERIADGDHLRDSGRYDDAARAYADALALLPMRTDIRIQHGNMLKDSGRLAEAEAAYRAGLADTPDNAEIHLQLGHVFKLQGQRDKALEAYRRAADLAPSLEAAWAELSRAGCPASQQQSFAAQVARGGVEALLALAGDVMRLQETAARLADMLPGLSGQMAFPLSSYDRFRAVYDVPVPPKPNRDLRFGVVLGIGDTPLSELYEQINSVSAQSYRNWQLAVVVTDPAQRRVVERAAVSDPRIGWVEVAPDETGETAERRVALTLAVDWLVLPARGARLHRYAIGWYAAAASGGTAVAFVADAERARLGSDGMPVRLTPQFRQVVDYDTLLEANPFGETIAIAQAAYANMAAGLVTASLGAARSSLLLALASRRAVGHIPLPLSVTASTDEADPDAADRTAAADHELAVRDHLAAAALADRVRIESPPHAGSPLRVEWLPERARDVIEVIIPTRDNADDVRELVQTLRRRAAVPDALRVLVVDNGSKEGETAQTLRRLEVEEGVSVVAMAEPFNWSRLNNRAAALSEAPLLVFANDDMLMLTDGWDQWLRGLLERPDIGAVGARLIYPDDTMQHAGILLGWPNIDVHDGRYEPVARSGPCCRWHVTRAVSAVTGAFLAVRRDLFEAVGGFDEIGLPIAYGDIDFALKLRSRRLRILWTPRIELRHFESKSRGLDHLDDEKRVRNEAERRLIDRRWGTALQVDPSVNPVWHTATLPFRLISPPSQQRLLRHMQLCASGNPWLPHVRLEPDPDSAANPIS